MSLISRNSQQGADHSIAPTCTNVSAPWEMVPKALKSVPRWILWRAENNSTGTRVKKVPIDRYGVNPLKNWLQPSNHMAFEEAVSQHALGFGDGIGFVFTGADGILGIDIDEARLPNSSPVPAVHSLLLQLGQPVEVSYSGTGYHIFFHAPKVVQNLFSKNQSKIVVDGSSYGYKQLELFYHKSFIALTGNFISDWINIDVDPEQALIKYISNAFDKDIVSLFTPSQAQRVVLCNNEELLNNEDRALLESMRNAKNGKKFSRYYGQPNSGVLPIENTLGYQSRSELDIALARILVFWCCSKHELRLERVCRFMRSSQLVRPKWDERRGDQTWLELTITRAYEAQLKIGDRNFWNGRTKKKRSYTKGARTDDLTPPIPIEQLQSRMLPSSTLHSLGLTQPEIRTYQCLRSFNRGHAYVFPSQRTMAKNLGVSERTVRKHLRRIEAVGLLISCHRRDKSGKQRKSKIYWFLSPPPVISSGE